MPDLPPSFDEAFDGNYVAGVLTIGTSAVVVKVGASAMVGRQEVIVFGNKTNTDTIYIGPADVSVTTGLPVEPGEAITFTFSANIALYAICGTAGQTARIHEVG